MKEYATKEDVELAFSDPYFAVNHDQLGWNRVKDQVLFYSPWSTWEEPIELHGWAWSDTFRRWGALVTFEDGMKIFAFPKDNQ